MGGLVRTVSGIELAKGQCRSPARRWPFTTKASTEVNVTKTFRLFPNTDGLEVDLKFESPDKERSVSS